METESQSSIVMKTLFLPKCSYHW